MGTGLPGIAYLINGDLGLLVGPCDYSYSVSLVHDVDDFDVVWSESSNVQDELFVLRNDRIEWWRWEGAPFAGHFTQEVLSGSWSGPSRVVARGPNAGGYGVLAVLDANQDLFMCLLNSTGVFWYRPAIGLGGLESPILDLALVDVDSDGLYEIVVQTTQEVRVYDFHGLPLFGYSLQSEKAFLFPLYDGLKERLVSVMQKDAATLLLQVFDSQGLEEAITLLGTGLLCAAAADLDGDLNTDVVIATDSGTESLIQQRLGPAFMPGSSTLLSHFPHVDDLTLVDLDWDGDADLIGRGSGPFQRLMNRTLAISPPDILGVMLDQTEAHVVFESAGGAQADSLVVTLWRRTTPGGDVDPLPVGSVTTSFESLPWGLVVPFVAPEGAELIVEVRPIGQVIYAAAIGQVADPVPGPPPPPPPRGNGETQEAADPPLTIPVPYVPPFTSGSPIIPWL